VLGRQQRCEAVVVPVHEFQELEHDARAPLRIGPRPGRLRRRSDHDGMLDLGVLRQRHLGLDLAGVGIEYVAEAPRIALDLPAAHEVADFAHRALLKEIPAGASPACMALA